MGVFDTVTLHDDVHLPEFPDRAAPAETIDWQTKRIARPSMTSFRITAHGRLLEQEWHTESVPPEDRPFASQDGIESGDFRYLVGSRKRVHEGWIERDDFHGRFVITHSPDEIEPLLKYRVTFTHGRLEGFERVWLESPHPLQIPGSGQS
jgi:hypothetical protein